MKRCSNITHNLSGCFLSIACTTLLKYTNSCYSNSDTRPDHKYSSAFYEIVIFIFQSKKQLRNPSTSAGEEDALFCFFSVFVKIDCVLSGYTAPTQEIENRLRVSGVEQVFELRICRTFYLFWWTFIHKYYYYFVINFVDRTIDAFAFHVPWIWREICGSMCSHRETGATM